MRSDQHWIADPNPQHRAWKRGHIPRSASNRREHANRGHESHQWQFSIAGDMGLVSAGNITSNAPVRISDQRQAV